MSIADALERISQIQQQLEDLTTGASTSTSSSSATSAASSGATGTSGTSTTSGTSATAATDFANALAQVQGTSDAAATDPTSTADTVLPVADTGTGLAGLSTSAVTGGSGLAATGATAAATTPLPTGAGSLLTSGQQQFASALAADTGLSPGVISAWVLAEESGSAAQSRQAQGNNDWLNIGYTGGATYGAGDSAWSDPVTAASATAGWLKGQDTIQGYGTASAGIQAILQTVGQTPAAQISALQGSGWASSGYPDLPALYSEVTG